MEIHQLRYFLAVAQTRNFSRAAERCHVAQPSLSQQIMKLEGELGERLFERTKRDVELTPAGELFQQHAQRVMDELDVARDRIRDVSGLVRGRIQLGALPTVAPYLLPEVLRRFSAKYPDVELVVHEDTTANLVQSVEKKEIDAAIVSVPLASRRLQVEEFLTEELWLALPPAHPLAKKRRVQVADLDQEPFILMKEGHCLAGQTLQFCQARGLAPRASFRSAQVETVQAFIAAGLGVSLVPAMARRVGKGASVVYRSIAPAPPRRTLALIRHEHRASNAAVQAFSRFLREA